MICRNYMAKAALIMTYYDESQRMIKENLAMYEEKKVDDQYGYAWIKSLLANLLSLITQFSEAEPLVTVSKGQMLSIAGPDSSGTQFTIETRALLRACRGQFSAAEKLSLELLQKAARMNDWSPSKKK